MGQVLFATLTTIVIFSFFSICSMEQNIKIKNRPTHDLLMKYLGAGFSHCLNMNTSLNMNPNINDNNFYIHKDDRCKKLKNKNIKWYHSVVKKKWYVAVGLGAGAIFGCIAYRYYRNI